jgi:hypothetical protein
MYLSMGRDIPAGSNALSLKGKANIIEFKGIWIGLTASFLF